jgi:D-3-phosphoglycerate dehydrogenase
MIQSCCTTGTRTMIQSCCTTGTRTRLLPHVWRTYATTTVAPFEEGEELRRTLSRQLKRMERNTKEWKTTESNRGIQRLYKDYRVAALSEDPPYDPVKKSYTIDANAPPPFLFSSSHHVFAKPPKVILTSDVAEAARGPFERAGFNVQTISPRLRKPLLKIAADCHLLGIGPDTILGEDFFRQVGYTPHRLWAIGHFGGGTKNIHLLAAAARGIACFHARNASSRSVAEKSISDIISLHRQVQEQSHAMHQGIWQPSVTGREVRGMKLGIVGYGRVGRQISVLAETLGMKVFFHEIKQDVLELGNAKRIEDLDELLSKVDCLCLSMSGQYPKKDNDTAFITERELKLMKRGSIVINNGSPDSIDVQGLANVLKTKHLAGAALDSFPSENTYAYVGQSDKSVPSAFDSPLRGISSAILTPGIAGNTMDATKAAAREVSTKLLNLISFGSTATCVNLPQVEVAPPIKGVHRIVHMHRSVPGVMSNINSVIASTGANIHGQLLQTDGSHGYCIFDVERSQGRNHERARHRQLLKDLKSKLRAVPHTMYVKSMLRSNKTFGGLSPDQTTLTSSYHESDLEKHDNQRIMASGKGKDGKNGKVTVNTTVKDGKVQKVVGIEEKKEVVDVAEW